MVTTAVVLACASAPTGGPLNEGTVAAPTFSSVDTMHPPKFAMVQLADSAHVALLLVAPGHSATLLYPTDSLTNTRLLAGVHRLDFQIPEVFAQSDSERIRALRDRIDTVGRGSARNRGRNSPALSGPGPVPTTTQTYLLLVTSPQPFNYGRIHAVTTGVSIPIIDMEALNAVAKAVRSTITVEPRDWAGAYQKITIRRP